MAAIYGTCRNRGEKLLRSEHVRFGPVLTDEDEKASGSPRTYEGGQVHSWIHRPCPKCNEPRPLSRRWRQWLILVVFVILFALGIWSEFG